MVGRVWWLGFALIGRPIAANRSRTGNWTTVSCEEPAIIEETLAPEYRWSSLDCDHAWEDVIRNYHDNENYKNIPFPSVIWTSFTALPAPVVRASVGYIISSSVVAVYNIFNTLDAAFSAHISDGVDNFGAPFGFKAEKLTKTSQEDKDKLVSVMLDTSQIATLAAIAPSINISISESRYTRTNDTLRNHLFETTMSIVAPDLKELLKSTNISDTNE